MATRGGDLTWDGRYRRELSSYEACAEKLELLLEDLLTEAGIDVVNVESRAKDPDSLVRKVEGKKDEYSEPLSDVTDLIGLRVIAYYLEDVERIGELIQSEFVVDPDNSTDKLDDLEPDRFGYRSVHYIVSLSEERSPLTEWRIFAGKQAEIQVRTSTQHAWAAIEHKLSYKRASEAPRDVRRKLTRLSALFELADEQFSAVRQQLEEVETQYSDDVRGGNLDLPIDKASLEAFFDGNPIVDGIVEEAQQAGFTFASPDNARYEEQRDVDFRDLVAILEASGVATVAELDALLRQQSRISEATGELGPVVSTSGIIWRSSADLLCLLILFVSDASQDLITSVYHPNVVRIFTSAGHPPPE